jgi:hypothetical protein
LKHTWGGKRPGGGRPRSGIATGAIGLRMPVEVLAALRAEAQRRGVTASIVVADLVREVLVAAPASGETEAGA